jgi:hypothetical protein
VTDDGELRDRPAPSAVTHEQAERLERLRQGAEALGHLKPHEIRALVLKAEGFSYREICEITGWSYTKVNRLLTEGRRAFLRRVSGIQRGADCARYEPILSALADGEASAEDLAVLRPHMRTCLSCRAALREFRAMPERVASVVSPGALAAADDGTGGPLRNLIESIVGAAQHKTAAMGERLHAAAELATGQKVAAVAASAAALAGGGTAIDGLANHRHPTRAAQSEEPGKPPADEAPAEPAPPVVPPAAVPEEQPVAVPAPTPAPAPEPEPAPPPPDPANEFDPTGAAEPSSAPPPSPPPEPEPTFGPAGGGGDGSASGAGGEFAP